MKQILIIGAITIALAGASSAVTRTPVVVELFTSEGCSSCPPADQLLADLDRSQPDLIVLSEHVDYWNRLGWSDPYSSAVFSERQQKYAAKLGTSDVYTPQAVVDGQFETVGSNAGKVHRAIGQAARQVKIPLVLAAKQTDGKIEVQVQWDGAAQLNGHVAVYVAVAQNEAQSHVNAGENSGRMLQHVAVVRQIAEVGALIANTPFSKEATLAYNPKWGGVRVVAFLQEKSSGRIVGAAEQKL